MSSRVTDRQSLFTDRLWPITCCRPAVQRSSGSAVQRGSGLAVRSLGHLVAQSSGHRVFGSSSLPLIQSSAHPVVRLSSRLSSSRHFRSLFPVAHFRSLFPVTSPQSPNHHLSSRSDSAFEERGGQPSKKMLLCLSVCIGPMWPWGRGMIFGVTHLLYTACSRGN